MQSNLPNGFCKDINRENGWELVLNRCGSRSIKNNNFIALYNNYTGTLRFFYYQPENFQTGNDHVWEVKMTDNMAQNSTLRYSVPQDRSIKHKEDIGQTTTDNTIVEYIAPWVGSLSQDGLITPNAGWWAFDVDLSLYSGKGLRDDDNIALQMRSWDMSHVSLASLLTASIDGSIKANVDLLQSQHLSNSVMGMVAKAGSIGGNVYKMATALETMQWGTALGQGTIDGTLTMTMTGNIETTGTIEAAKPTQGIASPTLFMKDFDRTNAPAMGEGIWNLSQSPVVYYTDVTVDYKSEELHTTKVWTRPVLSDKKATFWDYMKYAAKKSPFDGVDNSRSVWFAEFQTEAVVSPVSYTLVTANDNAVFSARSPRTWALYGRETVNEAWTLLDRQETAAAGGVPTANALPHTNLTAKDYQLNASTAKNMRYFRFEVLNTWDNGENSYMQLGELKLNFTAPTN